MNTRKRLTATLRPVAVAMGLSIGARIIYFSADLVLVASGAWGVAALAEGSLATPWVLAGVLIVTALLKALARYVEQYQGHHVAFGLLSEMRSDFFRRVEPLAPAAVADTRSGDLVERVMSDVDRVEVFYAHTVAPVVAGVVVPILTVVGLAAWSDVRLAIVPAVAMMLVGLIVPWLSNRSAQRSAHQAAAASGELAAHITDGIQGLSEAVTFDYGERRLEEMERRAARLAHAEAAAARIDGIRAGINQLLVGATLSVVALLGISLMEEGGMTFPVLAGTLAVTLMAFRPLEDIQAVKPAYDRAMAAAGRIFEITDRSPVVTDPPHPAPVADHPALHFEAVSFAYPGHGQALRHLTLAAEPGSSLAIVGPSGAGKSTVARLAVRFWDPDDGKVTLADRQLTELAMSDVRKKVTVVTQQSHLFSGTVAENLLIGRPDATREEMREAARVAAVERDIEKLPARYETQVGELGMRLSGGQRQRIALARGLLADAPILILDEATSDLDVDTEAELMVRLRSALGDKALLVISHRLAPVVGADEIVVVDDGTVTERGTHDQLLARDGLYARLWARQRDEL